MTIIAYAALWACLVAAASLFDNLIWLRYVRPAMVRLRGWPPVHADERIPIGAAAIGGGAAFILLFVLPWVCHHPIGRHAGY